MRVVDRKLPPLPAWLNDFARFGLVGMAGFVTNTVVLYAIRRPVGLYAAGVLAWLAAVTVTWALNRAWTFKGRSLAPMHRQWFLFVSANFLGFILYYATYATLVANVKLCAAQPVLAVFAGVMAGMFANFTLSRRFVFR